jgi:hypothetical protein
MRSQNVGSAILAENTESENMPAGAAEGVPTEGTTEELGIDELLDYEPVPPRLVTRISLRYQRPGRGRPLPYLLDEVGPE